MAQTPERYLIIGGTTKGATTSLFFYLKDHPEVCTSSIKEARYWLDADYPLQSKNRYVPGQPHDYGQYFTQAKAGEHVGVEATPDYLYSPATANYVQENLSDVKMLFTLREPISRLVSWYRFAQQNGDLDKEVSLESYIERMLALGEPSKDTPQYLRALEQGRYHHYLQHYMATLGKEQVGVVYYEDLKPNPTGVMRSIAELAGIDAAFYDTYQFEVKNETKNLKNPKVHQAYKRFRFVVRNVTHKYPVIHRQLQRLRRGFEPLYMKLNEEKAKTPSLGISEALQARLVNYYAADVAALHHDYPVSAAWQTLYTLEA